MRPRKKEEIACILGIFLFALLLRTYALTSLPIRAITDDAYEYNYIAQNIPNAIKGHPLENKDTFLYYGAKRGWLYPLFIVGIYKVFGPHDLFVRLAQVIIDSLTCLLIYFIGRDVFNKQVGGIAAFISSLYPGFIYYSTMLYQETTTVFLLCLYVFCLCRALSKKMSFFYCASGVLLIIISFYRSGFLFFPLLVIPSLLFILRLFYKKYYLRYFFSFLTGAFCMFILYGIFSYVLCGTFNFNKPSIAWSFYETIHRDGWITDTFSPTPTKELYEVVQNYSPPLSLVNQMQKLPPEVYLKAGFLLILKQPVQFLSQLIKRCERMWTYIETYPGKWHSQRVWTQLLFHRCLVLLALVGIPLSLTVWHHCWLFFSIFLYVTIAYIPIIGLPRYAVPAMPFVIILATHALFVIIDTLKHHGKHLFSSMFFPHFIATGVLIITTYFVNVPNLLNLFPQTSPTLLYMVTIISVNLFLFVIAYWGYVMFILHFNHRFRSLYLIALPLATVMVLFNNSAFTSKTWHEWEAPLSLPYQKVKQTIVFPHDLNFEEYSEARVLIDMFPGGGEEYNFQVNANGNVLKLYRNGIKAREKKFDQKFFGLYKSFFFDTYKLSPEDLRQWYEIALPLHFLENNSPLVIECFLSGTVDRKANNVIVFGDYHTTRDKNLFEGPCFPRSDLDTSLTKIMPYAGDYRFEKVTPLSNRKTISEYYDGRNWQREDLSSTRGIQSGSYRIRVELIGNNGNQVIW